LLLEKELIEPEKLKGVLEILRDNPKKLGEAIVESKLLSENQLLLVLGELWGTGYLENIEKIINPYLAHVFPRALAAELQVAPLMSWSNKILLASSRQLDGQETAKIFQDSGLEPIITLIPFDQVQKAVALIYEAAAAGEE
jgi:type IV pilus assembly protein PilB